MNKNPLRELINNTLKLKNPEKAEDYLRFFKTGKGQYGEGDKFLGLTNPQSKQIAKKYKNDLSLPNLQNLISSEFHEHRYIALEILKHRYSKAKGDDKKIYADFYLENIKHINNWDLVDISAPHVLGDYLINNDRSILYKLAKSDDLWERRISILATFAFIKKNDFSDTMEIAEMLVDDKHDLIHKAVGWLLREVGKRNQKVEEEFLRKHYKTMPRTMLRYAIEKFDYEKRDFYMGRKK